MREKEREILMRTEKNLNSSNWQIMYNSIEIPQKHTC